MLVDREVERAALEDAELVTAVPYWSGAAGNEPLELLHPLGEAGERIHVRAAPRLRTLAQDVDELAH